MECPICGNECQDLKIVEFETPFEDIAEYVFKELVSRGYAPNYDDVNLILDIVNDYMFQFGECEDES